MKYLVMETHPAYAVVLDEEGRFLKAANLQYRVGDTVQHIVELRQARPRAPALWKPLSGLAAAAACLCLVFFGYYQPNYTAYGTLRIQINPDVEMTVSRTDRVLDLEGLNADGEDLIEGYDYRGKDRETALNADGEDLIEGYDYRGKDRETAAGELVERAIDMGYLSDGDTISVTVRSDDADWQAREEAQVQAQLEERYGATIVIQLGDGAADQSQSAAAPEEPAEVVVPVTPQSPEQTTGTAADPAAGAGGQEDTDYGPGADGVTDYADTDYGPNSDGVTDYADTDYGPNADGITDYADTDYGPNADGVTDYTDPSSGPYYDGVTDYEDREDDGGDDDDGDRDDDRDDEGDDDGDDDRDGEDDDD